MVGESCYLEKAVILRLRIRHTAVPVKPPFPVHMDQTEVELHPV